MNANMDAVFDRNVSNVSMMNKIREFEVVKFEIDLLQCMVIK